MYNKYASLPSEITKPAVAEHAFFVCDQNTNLKAINSHFLGRAAQFLIHCPINPILSNRIRNFEFLHKYTT